MKNRVQRIYKWNFVQLAEVLRKTRLHLQQQQIQDLYSLKVVLVYLMALLKSENPLFSRQKFIQYSLPYRNDVLIMRRV